MKKIKWLAVLASLLCGAVFAETTTPDGETAEGDGANSSGTINLCVGDVFNVYEKHNSAYTLSLKSNSDSTVALGEVAASSVQAGKFYTITAKKAGNTTIVFNNKKSGTTYTATFTVNVSEARVLEPGAQTTVSGWGNENEPGSSTWTQSVDPSGRVTVTFGTRTTKTMTATLTAGQTEGNVKVTIKNVNSNSGSEYVYAVKIEKSRAKHNEAISVAKGGKTAVTATSEGASAWGISSADTTIATVDPTAISATESAKFEVAGVKVGDTTVAATNAAAIWNYSVTVYDTNTVALVVTNGTPRTVTCTSEKAATWSVASSDTGVATVSGSSATATISATVTGVAPGDAVVTVSNKYQITTINVRVVEVKEDEKEIPLAGGGTVECESPVKAKWTAKYDDTFIKSVNLKSLDDLVKVFALSATQDGPVAKKVEVTVEPREGLEDGTETEVLVSNGYTTYTLKLTITKPTETKSLPISCGAAWTNELEGVKADYDVDSEDPAIAMVEIVELEDTTNLVITAIKNGNTKVTVEGPTKTVVYEVIVSTVEIEKTVKPSATKGDWSNATIRVAAHIDYVKNTHTNNILYLGSTCTSHTLDTGKIAATLNTLKSKGNVQWALFGVNQSEATSPSQTGTLKMGQADIRSQDITGGTSGTGGSRHRNLRAYLNYLNTNLDDAHEKFDYVVLSFDGGRLAIDYSSDNPSLNANVAQKLDWYYKNDRMIWITDSAAPATGQDRDEYEQFRDTYYRPANTHDDGFITVSSTWEAMVALLDPETYLTKPAGSRYTYTMTSTGAHPGTTIWAVRRLEAQASYSDNQKVLDLLNKKIKPVSYDSEVKDKVVTSVGDSLTIPEGADKVRFYTWAGETEPAKPWADQAKNNTHWQLVTPSPVEIGENNQITVVTSNLAENAYMLLEIDVLAKEDIIEKAKQVGEPLCKWDDANQVWVIDPNDGEATLSLSRNVEGEEPQLYAKGSGATLTKWNIPAQPIVISATDYFDVYDGEAHTIDFTVNPAKNPDTLKDTQVRFSTDNSTWTDWTNYTDCAEIWPTWTDCCWSNKVYIEARCVPGYADTNALAYVTITQRVLRVTATDASKTYGGDDPTFEWTLSGDVLAKDRETVCQNLSNSASIVRADYPAGKGNKAGTYTDVLGSNGVFSATGNYKVEFEPGDFTINPAELTLTAKAYSGVYDGEGHTIGLEINVTNDTSVTGGGGSGIFIRTSIDNTHWSKWTKWPADIEDILPKATNVDDTVMTVYVQATNEWAVTGAFSMDYKPDAVGNYKPTSTNATVTITKRPVTLSTSSVNVTVPSDQIATFTEDKIVDATAGQKNKGYVGSEKFTYSNLAVNSTPGTTIDATFDYAANATILANNYTVSRTYGKLTVQPIPLPPSPGCQLEPAEPVSAVYQWKFQGRTTAGYAVESIFGATACNLGTSGVCAIRVPAALAIQGYTYICENCCGAYNDFDSMVKTFFMTKPFKSLLKDMAFNATGHIIGKAAKQYELFGTLEAKSSDPEVAYTLKFAGLGNWNRQNVVPTAVTGNFAGTADAPYFIGTVGRTLMCINADWWTCGNYAYAQHPDAKSVAYGSWSMRYNATASKKYRKGITIALPAWARALR